MYCISHAYLATIANNYRRQFTTLTKLVTWDERYFSLEIGMKLSQQLIRRFICIGNDRIFIRQLAQGTFKHFLSHQQVRFTLEDFDENVP